MGLSLNQVSGNGFDWTQNLLQSSGIEFSNNNPPLLMQQQQPLNCPRCDSTNTKFCYYNNYNRTQPRHFCKSCRRHWTKGGMLRNVPVGGGRKKKPSKISNKNKNNNKKNLIINSSKIKNNTLTTQLQQQQQQKQEHIKVEGGDHHHLNHQKQNTTSEFLYQMSLINPTSMTTNMDFVNMKNVLLGSSSIIDNHLSNDPIPSFQFKSLSSIDNHNNHSSLISSSSFSNGYLNSSNYNGLNYNNGDSESVGSLITNMNPITTSTTMLMQSTTPWQTPNTSNFMNSSTINWSWEDLNTFVSTDLKQPWEDNH